MEYVELANGLKMPVLGLGTWLAKDPDVLKTALRTALDVGYRHIDTAQVYGNEAVIGEVLNEYFSSGKLKREDIFITTKLPFFVYTPDDIDRCFEKQLKDLQVDYVDLFLLHCPCVGENVYNKETGRYEAKTDGGEFKFVFLEYDHVQIWRCLETFYEDGRAKAIGLSNFNKMQLQHILDRCAIWPYNLQVEAHLYWPQDDLVEFCEMNRITFTAFAPLGSPGRKMCDPSIYWPDAEPLKDDAVIELAKNYKKTPAQILLRFLIQRGLCVIPKSVNPERVKENFEVFDFKLSDDDMERLKNIPTRKRLFLFEWFFKSPHFPFDDVDRIEIRKLMGEEISEEELKQLEDGYKSEEWDMPAD